MTGDYHAGDSFQTSIITAGAVTRDLPPAPSTFRLSFLSLQTSQIDHIIEQTPLEALIRHHTTSLALHTEASVRVQDTQKTQIPILQLQDSRCIWINCSVSSSCCLIHARPYTNHISGCCVLRVPGCVHLCFGEIRPTQGQSRVPIFLCVVLGNHRLSHRKLDQRQCPVIRRHTSVIVTSR